MAVVINEVQNMDKGDAVMEKLGIDVEYYGADDFELYTVRDGKGSMDITGGELDYQQLHRDQNRAHRKTFSNPTEYIK